MGALARGSPGPERPADQIHQVTLPHGVDPALAGLPMLRAAAIAKAGSSPAAGRPVGYRDGSEDPATVPPAAAATTVVIAWWLWTGPVTAGTTSVPPGAALAWPGRA